MGAGRAASQPDSRLSLVRFGSVRLGRMQVCVCVCVRRVILGHNKRQIWQFGAPTMSGRHERPQVAHCHLSVARARAKTGGRFCRASAQHKAAQAAARQPPSEQKSDEKSAALLLLLLLCCCCFCCSSSQPADRPAAASQASRASRIQRSYSGLTCRLGRRRSGSLRNDRLSLSLSAEEATR